MQDCGAGMQYWHGNAAVKNENSLSRMRIRSSKILHLPIRVYHAKVIVQFAVMAAPVFDWNPPNEATYLACEKAKNAGHLHSCFSPWQES